jgi:hypothetical protein
MRGHRAVATYLSDQGPLHAIVSSSRCRQWPRRTRRQHYFCTPEQPACTPVCPHHLARVQPANQNMLRNLHMMFLAVHDSEKDTMLAHSRP